MPAVHVLVDLENNQPTLGDVQRMVPDVTDVWLFHSAAQKKHLASFEAMGERQTPVPITRKGSNALDFHLTFYLGYLAAKNPGAKLVVMAIDKGYMPMVEHARAMLKLEVAQVAFRVGQEGTAGATKKATPAAAKKAPAAKKAAAKKTPAKKTPAKKAAAKKSTAKVPAAKKAAAKKASPANAVAKKHTVAKQAAKQALKSPGVPSVKGLATAPAKAATAKKATGGAATSAAGAAPAAKKVASKLAARAPTPRAQEASAKAPLPAPALASKEPAAATRPPAPVKQGRSLDLQAVVDNLRKMGDKRPKKRKQLERHLASLLGTEAADQSVHGLVAQLQEAGAVRDTDGALMYGPAVASAAS